MAVNQIEVRRISIVPLSAWTNLRRTQKPEPQRWPESSNALCWTCCHPFSHVPVFLPVECDIPSNVFVCTGNFCSWNCCKKYAFDLQRQNKAPRGVVFLGLLSFLTCHRSTVCVSELHDLGLCSCLSSYRCITIPPPKEVLKAFGGHLSIEDYRADFLCITDYNWVETHFHRSQDMSSILSQAKKLPAAQRRAWGFEYITYPAPPGTTVEYVHILPLSNRVMRQEDQNMLTLPHTSAHSITTSPPSAQASMRQKPRPRPSRTKLSKNEPTRVDQPPPTGPSEREVMMTPEQLLTVNEEQAYYTQNLRQFGNIVDSMGISITKPRLS
jgi:hypothetical protein